ncbi:5'-methylthioadenosine/adenosylhomocysteine nucleosidase [soil metagenome]
MRIGIIGAMDEAMACMRDALAGAEEQLGGGFTLYRGELEGKEVVVSKSGIGKVNAAVSTQCLLLEGVDAVIFTGVAGALDPELGVGDLVVSTDLVQHDVDVSALGYALGEVPGEGLAWAADARLHELALAAAREAPDVQVKAGRIVSGDQFIADAAKVRWLRRTFGAVCAEMEGASAAQVCARYRVPFVVVRSISDAADDHAEGDFRAFAELAAFQAERVVRAMLRRL